MQEYILIVRAGKVKHMLPAKAIETKADGTLWCDNKPILGINDPAEKARIVKLIKAGKMDQIPDKYFTRLGNNLNGLWAGTLAEWQTHPAKIEADRRAEQKAAEEAKIIRICLSSRGWGDLSPVAWTGDITRPENEILNECRAALNSARDVDHPQTDNEILAKIQKARAKYEAKLEEARQEKIAQEKEKAEIKALGVTAKVIKSGEVPSAEEGCFDYFAEVTITDNKTGETLAFVCRNVCDVGYVVNPAFEIFPGTMGGLGYKAGDKYLWRVYQKSGEFKERKMSDFERRAYIHLHKNPPIYNGINM